MIIGFKEYILEQQQQKGTYAAVSPDKESGALLIKFMKHFKIPNPELIGDIHCTLLYSRKHLPKYKPDAALEYSSTPIKFDVWDTKSGKKCLVVVLSSNALQARHKHLMDKHSATYHHPEYKCHISLSYNIGEFDISKLTIADLPKRITLTNEYAEQLDVTGK